MKILLDVDNTLVDINTHKLNAQLIRILKLFDVNHVSFLTRMNLDSDPSITGVLRCELIDELKKENIIVDKVYTPFDINAKSFWSDTLGDTYEDHMKPLEALLEKIKNMKFFTGNSSDEIEKREFRKSQFRKFKQCCLPQEDKNMLKNPQLDVFKSTAEKRVAEFIRTVSSKSILTESDAKVLEVFIVKFHLYLNTVKLINDKDEKKYGKDDIIKVLNFPVEEIVFVDDSLTERESVNKNFELITNCPLVLAPPPFPEKHPDGSTSIPTYNFITELTKKFEKEPVVDTKEKARIVEELIQAEFYVGDSIYAQCTRRWATTLKVDESLAESFNERLTQLNLLARENPHSRQSSSSSTSEGSSGASSSEETTKSRVLAIINQQIERLSNVSWYFNSTLTEIKKEAFEQLRDKLHSSDLASDNAIYKVIDEWLKDTTTYKVINSIPETKPTRAQLIAEHRFVFWPAHCRTETATEAAVREMLALCRASDKPDSNEFRKTYNCF